MNTQKKLNVGDKIEFMIDTDSFMGIVDSVNEDGTVNARTHLGIIDSIPIENTQQKTEM